MEKFGGPKAVAEIRGTKRHWIEGQLKQIGKSKTDMAKALDLAPPRVTEILQGTRRIQTGEIVPLAMFLHLPVSLVLTQAHTPDSDLAGLEHVPGMDPIDFRGEVRAGYWAEVPAGDWPDSGDREFTYAPAPTHIFDEVYALRVVGSSMDEVSTPKVSSFFGRQKSREF